MRSTDLPEIRRLPLFCSMAAATFDTLFTHAYVQQFPAGLELIRQGDPADFLHVVLEGSVELYAAWSDRQCMMGEVRPFGAFILAACIRDATYLMSARTIERSRVILVPAADLRDAFRQDGEFALSVATELAGAYRGMVRDAKGLKLRNARERVASYLLRQSRLAGDASSYLLPVGKRLLASYLGMTAENLSRTLRTLEEDGIGVSGARVTITNRARLIALVRPDALMDGRDPADIPPPLAGAPR
ncbi:MAG: helix-turn-helix domain-containing protein [Proteobacteria bacterium]|nr:helix-turn-helix domain-containing protein [Pseudomonadota bacterium]MBS0572083.1 helix-turn-helix domain-containing protein [Pseudomonadota bacterium]